jgi:hypothetical protein
MAGRRAGLNWFSKGVLPTAPAPPNRLGAGPALANRGPPLGL